jgi:hypothetical protein
MGEKLRQFDKWLLAKHESASRWIQRLTGYTCFQQSRVVVIIGFVFAIYHAAYNKDPWQFWVLFDVSVNAVLYSAMYYVSLQAEQLNGSSRGRFANSMRILLERDRILLTLFATVVCIKYILKQSGVAGSVAQVLLVNSLYLISCTPLPPSRGRIQEFLSTLLGHGHTAHNA